MNAFYSPVVQWAHNHGLPCWRQLFAVGDGQTVGFEGFWQKPLDDSHAEMFQPCVIIHSMLKPFMLVVADALGKSYPLRAFPPVNNLPIVAMVECDGSLLARGQSVIFKEPGGPELGRWTNNGPDAERKDPADEPIISKPC
jgi:hypothetical protein